MPVNSPPRACLRLPLAALVGCCLWGGHWAQAAHPPVPKGSGPAQSEPISGNTPKGLVRGSDQPEATLDEDLVYAVLVAEIAARRGDLAMAFTHFLHAAQLSRDPKMAELAVRAAVAGGDDAQAARGVGVWLDLAPDGVGPHQVAALLRIKAHDTEGALTHLRRLLDLAGADADAGYDHVIGIVGRVEDKKERVELMRALVDLDPDNPESHNALAVVAAAAEQSQQAESAARRALELRPGWTKPRTLLVRLLLSQDRRDEARTLLKGYVDESPEDHTLRLLYGQFLVEEKAYAEARHEFELLLRHQPKEPDALFAAGILSLQLEDLDAARVYFTRLHETGQRGDEASFYLGQVEEQAGHPATAIEWYAKSEGSHETEARVRTAVIRAKQGDVGRAREIVQQLRDQAQDGAEGFYLLEAEILDEVGRQDEAMAVYDAGLSAHPESPDLLYGRAMYAVKLERIEQAEADLRRIIEAEPDHADALNALGYTLADRTERYQEALSLIERAHKLKPEEPAILDSMGWIHYRLGRYDLALDYLRRALDALNDGEIAAHLGEVLWAMQRTDEAWVVWDAALKDHPEHAYLLEVVGRHRVTQGKGEP